MNRETADYLRQHGLTWRALYEYPMSWDNWRGLCVYYGDPDPGSNEPPEHSVEELHERITALEKGKIAFDQEQKPIQTKRIKTIANLKKKPIKRYGINI